MKFELFRVQCEDYNANDPKYLQSTSSDRFASVLVAGRFQQLLAQIDARTTLDRVDCVLNILIFAERRRQFLVRSDAVQRGLNLLQKTGEDYYHVQH